MARAYSIPTLPDADAYASEWQALRGELVALLDKVEGQYGDTTEEEAPEYEGLSRRVRELRAQVSATSDGHRRRAALQTVKRTVDRFSDRAASTEPADDLESAIAQIRSREARPQPAIIAPRNADGSQLVELTGLVSGLGRRLERLEVQLKAHRTDGEQVRDVASQVEQLAQVVELLAGAVGETGQVKRLEAQIASLTDLVQSSSGTDLGSVNARLDEVSATMDKLAHLQVQQMEREVAREERVAQTPDRLAVMDEIESGLRNVYDRIDAIERNVGLSQTDLDRLTQEMADLTRMLQGQQTRPDELMARLDAIQQDVAALSGGSDVAGLREDFAELRDSMVRSLEPRFERIEAQLDELGQQMSGADNEAYPRIETQLSELTARIDEAGAQLGTLSRLYTDHAESTGPDYEAMTEIVAKRAAHAVQKATKASRDEAALVEIEQRLADLARMAEGTNGGGSAVDQDALADLVARRTSEAVGKALPKVSTKPDTRAIDAMEKRLVSMLDSAGRETAERLARLEAAFAQKLHDENGAASPLPAPAEADDTTVDTTRVSDAAAEAAVEASGPETSIDISGNDLDAMLARLTRPGNTAGVQASGRDSMPDNPADDRPLVDPGFPAPEPAETETAPRRQKAMTEPPTEPSWPQFDPDAVERPPQPKSSLSEDEDPFGESPERVTDEPRPSAPATSQSTFIAAARRAQRAKQASADLNANTTIGRALARVRPGSGTPSEEFTAEAVPAEAEEPRRGLFKRRKQKVEHSEPSVGTAPDTEAGPDQSDVNDVDETESFVKRNRRPLLLATALVAVSALALNLAMQRMQNTAPAAEVSALGVTSEELGAPEATQEPAGDVSTGSLDDPATPAVTVAAAMSAPRTDTDAFTVTDEDLAVAARFTPARAASSDSTGAVALPDLLEADAAAVDTPADELPGIDDITTASLGDIASGPVKFDPPPETLGPEELRLAAANGDPRAQFEVAAIYTEGQSIELDYAAAAIWYERAAVQGFVPAQYRLGNLYETGNGLEKDIEAAALWYQRAAEAGNRMAMHNLAAIHAGGELGEQDFDTAAIWFEQAARHGMTDSQFNLGMLYARGLGVEQYLERSYKWFAIAASNGDEAAGQARDDMARSLSADAMEAANAEIAAFEPEPIDIAANFAPLGTWNDAFDPGEAITSQDVISKVQDALNGLGYEAGTPDGLMGPQTRDAIRDFETDTGMTESGAVNPRLLAVLGSQPV